MKLFSEMPEHSVFKNEEALSSEYLPEILPHRGDEIKQVARNISPLSKGRFAQNTFVFGPSGVGKTSAIKYVFREFEEYSEQVKTVYINCWDYRTPTALLTQIIIELGQFVQRRGWSRDEIMEKLAETLEKKTKGLVVCLDEVDQLDSSALYDLLRIGQYVDTPVGMIFISNNQFVFSDIEPRIRSSLGTDDVEFKAYSLLEMKDILEERAKEAFISYDTAVVTLCANHAVTRGGDVRIGLQCMLKAGRFAETRNARKVSVDHVKAVLKEVDGVKPKLLEEKLNEHEKILLDILKEGGEWTSGNLYKQYNKLANEKFSVRKDIVPVTDRSLRDFVNHLKEIGLIEVSEKKVGKSRIIWKK